MSDKPNNTYVKVIIVLLYVLSFVCIILGSIGYTTIAMFIVSIILISGSILGFIQKAIVFLPVKASISNYYGNEHVSMHFFGWFMNGLTLSFGIYLLYNIFVSNLSWLH